MSKKKFLPSVSFGIALLVTIPVAYFSGACSFTNFSIAMPESFDAVWPTLQILCR